MYEAEISRDPNPEYLDPKIRSLVLVLNDMMGLATFSSCEGHENRQPPSQWPCPMVAIVLDSVVEDCNFIRLVKHIGEHNALRGEPEHVLWTLTPHRGTFHGVILKPNDDPVRTLDQQQKGIQRLVLSLQAMEWELRRSQKKTA